MKRIQKKYRKKTSNKDDSDSDEVDADITFKQCKKMSSHKDRREGGKKQCQQQRIKHRVYETFSKSRIAKDVNNSVVCATDRNLKPKVKTGIRDPEPKRTFKISENCNKSRKSFRNSKGHLKDGAADKRLTYKVGLYNHGKKSKPVDRFDDDRSVGGKTEVCNKLQQIITGARIDSRYQQKRAGDDDSDYNDGDSRSNDDWDHEEDSDCAVAMDDDSDDDRYLSTSTYESSAEVSAKKNKRIQNLCKSERFGNKHVRSTRQEVEISDSGSEELLSVSQRTSYENERMRHAARKHRDNNQEQKGDRTEDVHRYHRKLCTIYKELSSNYAEKIRRFTKRLTAKNLHVIDQDFNPWRVYAMQRGHKLITRSDVVAMHRKNVAAMKPFQIQTQETDLHYFELPGMSEARGVAGPNTSGPCNQSSASTYVPLTDASPASHALSVEMPELTSAAHHEAEPEQLRYDDGGCGYEDQFVMEPGSCWGLMEDEQPHLADDSHGTLAVTSDHMAGTSDHMAGTSDHMAGTSDHMAVTSDHMAVTGDHMAVTGELDTNLAYYEVYEDDKGQQWLKYVGDGGGEGVVNTSLEEEDDPFRLAGFDSPVYSKHLQEQQASPTDTGFGYVAPSYNTGGVEGNVYYTNSMPSTSHASAASPAVAYEYYHGEGRLRADHQSYYCPPNVNNTLVQGQPSAERAASGCGQMSAPHSQELPATSRYHLPQPCLHQKSCSCWPQQHHCPHTGPACVHASCSRLTSCHSSQLRNQRCSVSEHHCSHSACHMHPQQNIHHCSF